MPTYLLLTHTIKPEHREFRMAAFSDSITRKIVYNLCVGAQFQHFDLVGAEGLEPPTR